MEKVLEYIDKNLIRQHFSCCAVASIDFSTHKYHAVDVNPQGEILFYDLASLTKPLTLASTFLQHPQLFGQEELLLLNHKAGLPMGGRLSCKTWKEQILNYKIQEDNTLYSDFSALRLQQELEQKSQKSLRELCGTIWDIELMHWRDFPHPCPITGVRKGENICGEVHDDNAFVIGDFLSHAGLFATIDGLAKTLLSMEQHFSLLRTMDECYQKHDGSRFIGGWDRVEDLDKTLAGNRAGMLTFGHLGFTGTSIWIDIERAQGIVLLTNATENYWYDRQGLNQMRKDIHNLLWS